MMNTHDTLIRRILHEGKTRKITLSSCVLRKHCKCTGKIERIPPRTHAEAPYRCSVRGFQGAKHTGNAKEHITTARRGMGGNLLGTHGET